MALVTTPASPHCMAVPGALTMGPPKVDVSAGHAA